MLLSTVAAITLLTVSGVALADKGFTMKGSQWAIYEEITLPNGNLHFYPADRATTMAIGGVQFEMPDASALSYVN
jgi:hypothetical protein